MATFGAAPSSDSRVGVSTPSSLPSSGSRQSVSKRTGAPYRSHDSEFRGTYAVKRCGSFGGGMADEISGRDLYGSVAKLDKHELWVLSHCLRDGDSRDDVRSKVIFMKIVIMMLAGVLLFTVPFLAEESRQHELQVVLNLSLVGVCAVSMLHMYMRGITATMIRMFLLSAGFVFAIASSIVWRTGNMCNIMVLLLDCALLFETPGDAKSVRALTLFLQATYIIFILCFAIDKMDEGRSFLHPWQEAEERYNWACFIVASILPPVLNHILMRHYIAKLNVQKEQFQKFMELSYNIAAKLANYDLDAAEELLSNVRASEEYNEFSDASERMRKPLVKLLTNLRAYRAFLPDSLFTRRAKETPSQARSLSPNYRLGALLESKLTSWSTVDEAVYRMRDEDYSLNDFHDDMVNAFPELELYKADHADEAKVSSGNTLTDEYQRTLGALYALYCLLRLDIDGKEILSFGVDSVGLPNDANGEKQMRFYNTTPWASVLDLLEHSDIVHSEGGGLFLHKERTVAMLALTAFHDIMKDTSFAPTVQAEHAPYCGYGIGESINDHDIALAYVLEHFSDVLPSFSGLEPGQRAPILFSQGQMGFNNGWLVQGEAPPGALFAKFKQVIVRGRASQADISFYFVHWLTDLAGAEPFGDKAWPGAEKFTLKFPAHVLAAFLESFSYVSRLASNSEVEVMEEYLESRWKVTGSSFESVTDGSQVAAMRIALMAQGFEKEAVSALMSLPAADKHMLSTELARTGRTTQFRRAPHELIEAQASGPALLVYYAPALLQKAKAEQVSMALRILAAVFRAARVLFPLSETWAEETITIRIDALKVLVPTDILDKAPWHLRRMSSMDAEAAIGPVPIELQVGRNRSVISQVPSMVTQIASRPDYRHMSSNASSASTFDRMLGPAAALIDLADLISVRLRGSQCMGRLSL